MLSVSSHLDYKCVCGKRTSMYCSWCSCESSKSMDVVEYILSFDVFDHSASIPGNGVYAVVEISKCGRS